MPPSDSINHLGIVRVARAKYATMPEGPERGWRITNEAALRFKSLGEDAGLYWKGPVGTHWDGYSIDVLMYRSTETFDVLQDAEAAAIAQWYPTTPTGHGDPTRFREPVGEVPEPPDPPDPPDPPEPPASDLERIIKQLAAIQLELGAIHVELADLRRHIETTAWPMTGRFGASWMSGSISGTVGPQK